MSWHDAQRDGATATICPDARPDGDAAAHLARASARADRRRPRRPGRPGHRRFISSICSTRPATCAPSSTARRQRLGCDGRAGRAGARPAAAIRPARRLRPRPAGMPRAATARPQPARPGDAGPARQPAAARRAQRRGADAALRRRCRRPRRDDRRDQIARSAARSGLRPAAGAAGRARHPDARRSRTAAGSSSSTPRRCRASWSTTAITRGSAGRRATRARRTTSPSGCRRRIGWSSRCTSARRRSSRSRAEIVAPAGRVFPPRRAVAAAADPARHRRRDRHAREHGQPGHHQQVHGDAARPLRAQIFLHLVDRRLARRRGRIRPRPCATASAA